MAYIRIYEYTNIPNKRIFISYGIYEFNKFETLSLFIFAKNVKSDIIYCIKKGINYEEGNKKQNLNI